MNLHELTQRRYPELRDYDHEIHGIQTTGSLKDVWYEGPSAEKAITVGRWDSIEEGEFRIQIGGAPEEIKEITNLMAREGQYDWYCMDDSTMPTDHSAKYSATPEEHWATLGIELPTF